MNCATTEVLKNGEWIFSDCYVDENGVEYLWETPGGDKIL